MKQLTLKVIVEVDESIDNDSVTQDIEETIGDCSATVDDVVSVNVE